MVFDVAENEQENLDDLSLALSWFILLLNY